MTIRSGPETYIGSPLKGIQSGYNTAVLLDGGWVVTWQSYGQDGSSLGVFQQAYNADGTPRGGETQVNTYTENDQSRSQITALSDGGWVVTWESDEPTYPGSGVYQQVYNADGSPRGGEIRVSTSYGGEYARQIMGLSNGVTQGEDTSPTAKARRSPPLHTIPLPGSRLIREWNGRRYVVEVVRQGFVMDGKAYRSLSAIALRITGTHWFGPRFFGL